nr:hypothetical protein CFP56_30914 [Quercus suber]
MSWTTTNPLLTAFICLDHTDEVRTCSSTPVPNPHSPTHYSTTLLNTYAQAYNTSYTPSVWPRATTTRYTSGLPRTDKLRTKLVLTNPHHHYLTQAEKKNKPSRRTMEPVLTESTTLLNAQIGFLDTHVAFIRIPLPIYPLFIQPITQLILTDDSPDEYHGELARPRKSWAHWRPFVNISVSPNECSIVCPREEADALFAPIRSRLDPTTRNAVTISEEDFSVIMIGGEGLEAGQRVLDLTSPLAMAGIPIFFITSYWSDFVLVPYRTRSKVIKALENRGFVFEAEAENGEAGHMTNPASPLLHSHHRNHSSASSFDFPIMSGTPPPTSVSELQARTFKLLKQHHVKPEVHPELELITCAGMKESIASSSATNFTQGKLQLGLIRCLTSPTPPQFLSITLTDSESTSLTLERRFLPLFANDGEDILLGKDGPGQIPITLDLHQLPTESTGIVCGVASRLIDGMKGRLGHGMFNMSYLSTARAGHVLVYDDELGDAIECLDGAQQTGVEINGAKPGTEVMYACCPGLLIAGLPVLRPRALCISAAVCDGIYWCFSTWFLE